MVRASAFPLWWDVNSVRVEGPAPPELTAVALAAEADRRLAGLEHRKVELEDEATGAPLAAGLGRLGWHVNRLLWMRRDGADPPVSRAEATELSLAQAAELQVEWQLEEEYMPDEASVRAFLAERETAEAKVPGELRFLGTPGTAFVSLRLDGADGEIEDAYVTAAARGRGLGTALLHAAITRALDAEVRHLWILADADGRPRELYARLGFRPAWTYWDCVRRPPAKSDAPRR